MGELGALFNPGMRHELEERRSKAARREEEGNARDGDLHIDLASGIAVINVPADDEDGEESSSAAPAGESAPAGDESAPAGDASDDQGSAAAATSGSAAEEDEPAPPQLRPRGKRGMSSSSR